MAKNDSILLENFKKILSNQCSPEEIVKNKSGEVIAVKCGCGEYHPVINGDKLRSGEIVSLEVLATMKRRNVSYARMLAEHALS